MFFKLTGDNMKKTFMLLIFIISSTVCFASQNLTIIHTNDLHSHLLGGSPNLDYNPAVQEDDGTLGGVARLASLINKTRAEKNDDLLVLSAGDNIMGTLFHTVSRNEGFEYRLLKAMGYDATTIGNHELEYGTKGLAQVLKAALKHDEIPAIVSSNIDFSGNELEEFYDKGQIKRYIIINRAGLKIGIFGLLGTTAVSVSPFINPDMIKDPIATAKEMVGLLRKKEMVDVVICLSHSGVLYPETPKGEDIHLADKVKGIDIIISGHIHKVIEKPIFRNGTIIVQAGCNGTHAGVMEISVDKGHVNLENYKMWEISGKNFIGDTSIEKIVDDAISAVDKQTLNREGYTFFEALGKSGFDLNNELQETNIGDFVTDAFRYSIDKADFKNSGRKTDIAIHASVIIRDNIKAGKTGKITVTDLFNVFPLGNGITDDRPGYPMVSFYCYGHEIKKLLEIHASLTSIAGPQFSLQVSGVRFWYNLNRMIFDRVYKIETDSDATGYKTLDISSGNKTLYKIGMNYLLAEFIPLIGKQTRGILKITPKDINGNPLPGIKDAIVDKDADNPGMQELKGWETLFEYVKSFNDSNHDGTSEIPDRYMQSQNRIISDKSLNPSKMFKNSTAPTFVASGLGLSLIALMLILLL